ncbi:MAG: hypothetical protein AABX01_00760 [Candidatus Micrarchaeota archaeon]
MEIAMENSLYNLLKKCGAIEAINELLGDPQIHAVELGKSSANGKSAPISPNEKKFISAKKRRHPQLSKEEFAAMAYAKKNNAVCICLGAEESIACKRLGIQNMSIPMLLKGIWAKKIASKAEVEKMMDALESQGRIKFEGRNEILGKK